MIKEKLKYMVNGLWMKMKVIIEKAKLIKMETSNMKLVQSSSK
jgi:hypothetical protein